MTRNKFQEGDLVELDPTFFPSRARDYDPRFKDTYIVIDPREIYEWYAGIKVYSQLGMKYEIWSPAILKKL